jgi:hypothetical protein
MPSSFVFYLPEDYRPKGRINQREDIQEISGCVREERIKK